VAVESFLFGPLLMIARPKLMSLWNERQACYITLLRNTVKLYSLVAGVSSGIFWPAVGLAAAC
jgi:hypothetical protein